MEVSSARFIVLLVIVSFALLSSGVPVPQQNDILPNDPAPLEPDDDPARLKRYQNYGLTRTKVQRVQPITNLHPDARSFLNTGGAAQMAANPTGAAQGISAANVQPVGTTQAADAVPMGEETIRGQTGTMGAPLSGQPATQYGAMQVGQDVSDTSGAPGTGELAMSMSGGMPQAPPVSGGYLSPGGMNPSSRAGAGVAAVADSTTPGSAVRSSPDAFGVASSTYGAGTGASSLGEAASVRQAVPETDQGQMGGSMAAQSKSFNGNENPSAQMTEGIDGNGIGGAARRAPVSAGGYGANGGPGVPQSASNQFDGSRAQFA